MTGYSLEKEEKTKSRLASFPSWPMRKGKSSTQISIGIVVSDIRSASAGIKAPWFNYGETNKGRLAQQ